MRDAYIVHALGIIAAEARTLTARKKHRSHFACPYCGKTCIFKLFAVAFNFCRSYCGDGSKVAYLPISGGVKRVECRKIYILYLRKKAFLLLFCKLVVILEQMFLTVLAQN